MIEGVGAAGVLDLKAALYKEQQEAQQAKEDPVAAAARKSRRSAGIDLSQHARKNAGVEERDRLDREQIKTPADRLADSYSALERKAQLYDRLVSGQHDDEDELYNVDFVRKGTLDDERRDMGPSLGAQGPASKDAGSYAAHDSAYEATKKGGMTSADMELEQQRRQWEEDEWKDLELRKQEEARRDEKIEALERIEEETEELRERLARRKKQKESQAQWQREKIKAAFLKRQVAERIKAAKQKKDAQGGEQV
ncbi:probable coiled-coil domain-containing protein 174 at N-terminal half [Coccomyxa sp. Obi]|nr:probable coiled-coil domain-containing protein 174 at N-terminal half [Coccomyxa sp. Obi]